MSAAQELRETLAMIEMYKSEISWRMMMIENDDRYFSELTREQNKLKVQRERVERLLSYRGDGAQEYLNNCHERMAELKTKVLEIRNRAAIERLIRLTATLNSIEDVNVDVSLDSLDSPTAAAVDTEEEGGDDHDA